MQTGKLKIGGRASGWDRGELEWGLATLSGFPYTQLIARVTLIGIGRMCPVSPQEHQHLQGSQIGSAYKQEDINSNRRQIRYRA